MSDVTRYDWEGIMSPDPTGDFVYYEDYERLEQENARLRGALQDIADTREAYGDFYELRAMARNALTNGGGDE